MGRKKVELKRIADKNSRQVTFSKRRNGLMKKARELSVLCDVDVALVVFSNRGKIYEFCNQNSLAKIVERYQSHFEEDGNISTENYHSEYPRMVTGKKIPPVLQNSHSKYASFQTSAELLQIVQRHIEGPNVEQLSVSDLVQLEKQLDAALIQTRSRKTQLITESIMTLHEKERTLREENELLEREIAAMMENNGDNNANKVVIGFSNCTNNNVVRRPQQGTLCLLRE